MLANPNFHFPGRQNILASSPSAPPSPTPLSTTTDVKSKRRSSTHSRQLSFSNASSQSSPTSPARPTSRPVSGHHRRQSSVSSRRESREMMGLPSPTETSEESFSGDSRQHALWALEGKKSVPGLTLGFTKVEIPDWKTPDGEKEEFSWPNSTFSSTNGSSAKRALTPGSTTPLAYTPSSSLANKRDSFGKSLLSASSSLKEQLHTLMEEDEDEDAEEEQEAKTSPAHASELDQAPALDGMTALVEEPEAITEVSNEPDVISNERVSEEVISTPVISGAPFDMDATPLASSSSTRLSSSSSSLTETPASPSASPRPRPPTLQLRPLSLVSSLPITTQISTAANNTIPHSVRYKSLTLATNLPATQTTPSRNTNDPPRRHSLLMNGSQLAPSSSRINKQRRRGSLGYRRSGEDHNPNVAPSSAGSSRRRQSLPMTPALTPHSTVSGRSTSPSTPSDSISSSRASSEFFQSQAVSSLLSRIASLEEALAISTAATSPSSDTRMSFPILERLASLEEEEECVVKKPHMSQVGRQSTDELIDVIADLKAERDELNNDIVGWRTRCADLTHSSEALQRRLADERRELLLLHQRLSTVTTDLNDSRSAKLKLEDELVSERAAGAAAIRERQQLEEEVNDERMERIGLEMKTEKERLAWQKERNGWETERRGWFEERLQFEASLKRCEETIASLRAELDDTTRQLKRLQGVGSDPMTTSKLKQPWTGGKFAFPATPSPPRSESPEQPRPRTSTGFGGLNAGFKFGGGPSAPSSGNSTPRPLSTSPPADGPVPVKPLGSVAEEEDDNTRHSYDDGGDADATYSDDELSEVNSARSSAVNLNSPLPSPTSAVPVPAVHQHRRSVSRVTSWRFPSPRTLEQRRHAAANTGLKEKKDRFFACLEDEEEDQDCAAAPRLIGKPMKAKEHKKLPSGCPAFWLDCDDEDQVLKREAPLPSPATTEEEDDTETDSIQSKSPVSTTLSFPLIPRTIVTPASASNSRSSSPVDAPVTVAFIPPVNAPTSTPSPRPAAPRSTSPYAPSAPRVAPPVFIPATLPSMTPVPVATFSPAPLTTVPPAPKPSMTIPPSINVANNAVSSAPISPGQASTKVNATGSGYFGRLPTLSSMISWGSPRVKAPESEDGFAAQPATSSSAAGPSAPSPPPKIFKAKHVDPEVMRERLRLQLEREGRLSPTKPRLASGKVVMNHGALPLPTSIESCGNCNSRSILEL